jgi:hypothetical protein
MDAVERTADPSASLGMTKERANLSYTWMWWKELQILGFDGMTKERAKLSSTWMRWKELQIPRLRRDDKGEGEPFVHMDAVERTADPSASTG